MLKQNYEPRSLAAQTSALIKFWLARNARAYTSIRIMGFCAIWICISSSVLAAFEVNSEPDTGARPSVRLCMGPELSRCFHHPTSTSTSAWTSKTGDPMVRRNVATLVGTLVLNWNQILSSCGRLDVFIRCVRPPNHPAGTLFWPQSFFWRDLFIWTPYLRYDLANEAQFPARFLIPNKTPIGRFEVPMNLIDSQTAQY